MSRGTYALLVSLLPATATIAGVLVLAQIPVPLEATGVVLVVLGVAVHDVVRAGKARYLGASAM
ncbi:MAG: hypothetical protein HOV68_25410 [Streptomycetaceae bacterium]|nr:hypothetical protein [Streptomycetaceae bacterium]